MLGAAIAGGWYPEITGFQSLLPFLSVSGVISLPMTALRVLVVGSARYAADQAQADLIHKAGEEIGKELAERGHIVLVGSEDSKDIDPDVVRGALSAKQSAGVEVHLMQGATDCYKGLSANNAIKNIPHRYRDWDVTVLEVLRHRADAIIAVAGGVGVVQSGVAGWMLGRAVVAVATFGGGASTVWGYGSGERNGFYFGALTDEEIDRLQASWTTDGASARFVIDSLERIAQQAKRFKTPKAVFLSVSILVLLALLAWAALISLPLAGYLPALPRFLVSADASTTGPGLRFLMLLFSVCTAGALGSLMQTLRSIRDGRPTSLSRITIDLVLGMAAGFLTAALYMVAQIAITGKLEIPSSEVDYARIALIVGLAALFSSLYLDAALLRFDSLKDSVIAGKYGTIPKNKS